MLQNSRAQKLRAGLLCVAVLLGGRSELFAAQQSSQETIADWRSCNAFLVPQERANGMLVGQEDCRMLETGFSYLEGGYRRMDVRVSGTVAGVTATHRSCSGWLLRESGRTDGRVFQFGTGLRVCSVWSQRMV